MHVRAKYDRGAFRPLEPFDLAEGEQVELSIRRLDPPAPNDNDLDPAKGKRRALDRLRRGLNLGGTPLSREDAHRR